jgi:hypothetical protein
MTTGMPEKYMLISGNEFLALQDSLLKDKKRVPDCCLEQK